jgi:hypothetical protein
LKEEYRSKGYENIMLRRTFGTWREGSNRRLKTTV